MPKTSRVVVVGTTPDYIEIIRQAHPEEAVFLTRYAVGHFGSRRVISLALVVLGLSMILIGIMMGLLTLQTFATERASGARREES